MAHFVPIFVAKAKGVDQIKLADPENHTLEPKITTLYLVHSQSYDGLNHYLIFPIGTIVIFHIFVKKYVKC